MKLRILKNGAKLSGVETQNTIAEFLRDYYKIPKRATIDFIKRSRRMGYLYNNIITKHDEIIVYMEKKKMFLGIIPLSMSKTDTAGIFYITEV